MVDAAQHLRDLVVVQGAATIGDRLVQQAQAVAHAAVGGARDALHRRLLRRHRFRGQDLLQVTHDLVRQQAAQVEAQAARQDGDGNLLGVGGGEHELDVRRRLLERLQQRVEAAGRQHVHLVDDVHLVAAPGGGELHRLQQVPRVIHLGARGGVDFQHVHEAAFVDVDATAALAAGGRRHARLAVQALGQDARQRGLADSARAGQQKGVMDAVVVQAVDQRAHDRFLADDLLEGFGAPLARQYLVAHEFP